MNVAHRNPHVRRTLALLSWHELEIERLDWKIAILRTRGDLSAEERAEDERRRAEAHRLLEEMDEG